MARTERALGAALVALMADRHFDDISVQQVLARARVGRATFYAHYRNKHDLLLSEAERFCTMLEAHFLRAEGDGPRLVPVAELFAHVAEYHVFQRALAESGLRELVYDLVAAHLARTIARRLRERGPGAGPPPLPHAALARTLAGALMELLRWWLERDVRPTAAEMDAHFHAIARGGVLALA